MVYPVKNVPSRQITIESYSQVADVQKNWKKVACFRTKQLLCKNVLYGTPIKKSITGHLNFTSGPAKLNNNFHAWDLHCMQTFMKEKKFKK